jgi:transcriptional regulator with XRE-family HTH domain
MLSLVNGPVKSAKVEQPPMADISELGISRARRRAHDALSPALGSAAFPKPQGLSLSGGQPRESVPAAPHVQKTQVPLVMGALKELLRRRGLQQKDVASALGVAERTVARWMAASSVTMQAIEDICRVADITLLELFEFMHREGEASPNHLSLHQEQELANNPLSMLLFANLLHRIAPSAVQRQFDLSEADIVLALVKLENLGLITLFPGNRAMLTGSRNVTWIKDGPIALKRAEMVRKLFRDLDFTDPRYVSESNILRLSRRSLAEIEDKFRQLMREIIQLSQSDQKSGTETESAWHALIIAAHRLEGAPADFWGLAPHYYEMSGPRSKPE